MFSSEYIHSKNPVKTYLKQCSSQNYEKYSQMAGTHQMVPVFAHYKLELIENYYQQQTYCYKIDQIFFRFY